MHHLLLSKAQIPWQKNSKTVPSFLPSFLLPSLVRAIPALRLNSLYICALAHSKTQTTTDHQLPQNRTSLPRRASMKRSNLHIRAPLVNFSLLSSSARGERRARDWQVASYFLVCVCVCVFIIVFCSTIRYSLLVAAAAALPSTALVCVCVFFFLRFMLMGRLHQ